MSTIHPDRKKRVRTALRWFSIAAWVAGVWLLVLNLLATLNLGTKALWPPLRWVVTALAGCIPFLSFFVERWRRQEVTEKFQLDQP